MGDAIMNDLIEENTTWIDLKEEVPDEIDLQMLKEIKENPDCYEFMSNEEAMRELGL